MKIKHLLKLFILIILLCSCTSCTLNNDIDNTGLNNPNLNEEIEVEEIEEKIDLGQYFLGASITINDGQNILNIVEKDNTFDIKYRIYYYDESMNLIAMSGIAVADGWDITQLLESAAATKFYGKRVEYFTITTIMPEEQYINASSNRFAL
jgi:hypothetical protein